MSQTLPLIAHYDAAAPLLWRRDGAVTAGEFLGQVLRMAAALPAAPCLVNLCEERGNFLVAWCAAGVRGQTNLLPASRAPQVIAAAREGVGDSHVVDDETVRRMLAGGCAEAPAQAPRIAADHIIQIGFTSGSTGAPTAHAKRWGSLHCNTRYNAERIRECLGPQGAGGQPGIVATVPPQHMYGTETSVLLPLLAGMAVHVERPLFPGDVAAYSPRCRRRGSWSRRRCTCGHCWPRATRCRRPGWSSRPRHRWMPRSRRRSRPVGMRRCSGDAPARPRPA